MMLWASTDIGRSLATPAAKGVCPGCGGDVIAKCGEHVAWHWAHVAKECDPWSEPESEWHRRWKSMFPTDWQEKTLGPHRADVVTPKGVIEFQRSSISSEEIREREAFYGHMIWVIDANRFQLELESSFQERSFAKWLWKNHYSLAYERSTSSLFDRVSPDLAVKQRRHRIDQEVASLRTQFFRNQTSHRYRWLWPAKSWKAAQKTIFFDFGEHNLRTERESNFGMITGFSWTQNGGCYFNVKWMPKSRFVSMCS